MWKRLRRPARFTPTRSALYICTIHVRLVFSVFPASYLPKKSPFSAPLSPCPRMLGALYQVLVAVVSWFGAWCLRAMSPSGTRPMRGKPPARNVSVWMQCNPPKLSPRQLNFFFSTVTGKNASRSRYQQLDSEMSPT